MNYRTERHDQSFQTEDLPAMVVETLLRGVWSLVLLAWAILRASLRAPVPSALMVGLAFLAYTHGWGWVAVAAGALAAVLVVWRCLRADNYRTVVSPRVRAVWRSPAYRAWFPHVASRCGLYVHSGTGMASRGERECARLLKVQVKAGGLDRLLVRLPTGFTSDDLEPRLPAIAEALGARSATVRRHKPGRVWLELRKGDPLATVIAPLKLTTTDLRAVPVGVDEDGRSWGLRIRGTHTLIAGATGAGKGSILWSLVAGLRPAILAGTCEIWAIDPKGGMELGLGRGAFERFEGGDAEAMCELLEEAVDLKTRRAMSLATIGSRTHEPQPGSPHIVVIIDELATLTAFAERSVVRRIDNALGLLLTQGRAVGISVVAAVQDPGKDVVSWRDLFPTRVAMRLDNPIQVDMVLGEGGRDRGAAADQISELTPGVAYVRVEGTRDIRRVRAGYLDDAAVESLAAEIEHIIRPAHDEAGQSEMSKDEQHEEMRQEPA